MGDYLVRATAADQQIRAFAITSRDTVETARKAHDTSPVITAALGRLLSGGAMMGSMMKGDADLLTVQVMGDGPVGGLTVTADSKGRVKGYANVPQVILPANAKGKLDVGGAVGKGSLRVVKDLGLKEPYVGQTELVSGEIAEDLTYYFALSEQTPSAVGLGVLMNADNTVRQAGGFILQLMPDTPEETIAALEARLAGMRSVTDLLEEGLDPEGILTRILSGFDVEVTDTMPVRFYCNCGRSRMSRALISLGKKQLGELAADGEPIELKCQFCGRAYTFSPEEMAEMLKVCT